MPWTVLAVLTRPETAQAVLDSAGIIARRAGASSLAVLHVRHDPMEGFMPTEEVMTAERSQEREQEEAGKSAEIRAAFDRWQADRPGTTPRASWREVTAGVEDAIIAAADGANMVVVGRADDGRDPDASSAIQASLFRARMPTLLVRTPPPSTIGAHPAIAWKDGDAAREAIAGAMPVLLTAERVTVLTADEASQGRLFPPEIEQVLREHGVQVMLRQFETAGRSIGAALVEEARAAGADLLVMGAFGHGPLQEFLLGGATREILHEAEIPVLLKH